MEDKTLGPETQNFQPQTSEAPRQDRGPANQDGRFGGKARENHKEREEFERGEEGKSHFVAGEDDRQGRCGGGGQVGVGGENVQVDERSRGEGSFRERGEVQAGEVPKP